MEFLTDGIDGYTREKPRRSHRKPKSRKTDGYSHTQQSQGPAGYSRGPMPCIPDDPADCPHDDSGRYPSHSTGSKDPRQVSFTQLQFEELTFPSALQKCTTSRDGRQPFMALPVLDGTCLCVGECCCVTNRRAPPQSMGG